MSAAQARLGGPALIKSIELQSSAAADLSREARRAGVSIEAMAASVIESHFILYRDARAALPGDHSRALASRAKSAAKRITDTKAKGAKS